MATRQKNTQSSMRKKVATPRKLPADTVKVVAATGATHVKGQVGGFVDFLRSQGVIGLAVGLAIGSAAGDTVRKLVEGFINPIVQFIVGSGDRLSSAVWHLELFGRSADFAWGAALSSAITLLATALVIYWLVNVFKLDKLDKKKN